MRKLAHLALAAAAALAVAAPAAADHTEECGTDPIVIVSVTPFAPVFEDVDGCSVDEDTHCWIWVQSDAALEDGECINA